MNYVGDLPFEEDARNALSSLAPEAIETLLGFWSLPEAERAKRIGELHRRGNQRVADLLIDSEADPVLRLTVKEQLLRLTRDGQG